MPPLLVLAACSDGRSSSQDRPRQGRPQQDTSSPGGTEPRSPELEDSWLGPSLDEVVYSMYGAPYRTVITTYGTPDLGRHERPLAITNQTRDWSDGATRKVDGPFPDTTFRAGYSYGYHNVWGEVIPWDLTQVRGVRLQVDIPTVWHLAPGSSSWVLQKGWSASDVGAFDGVFYNGGEEYTATLDMQAVPGGIREESIGWSIDLDPLTDGSGSVQDDKAIVHFFWNGFNPRVPIAAGAQVAISNRFRLFSDDPSVDLGRARYVGCFSGDVYTDPDVGVDPSGVNPAFAHPRHVTLSPQWRWVGHVTGTEEKLRSYPKLPFLAAS